MTSCQIEVLQVVWLSSGSSFWYRARSSGERVTLASLFRKGLLKRRAWRGQEGDADAAHEYQTTELGKRLCVAAGRMALQERAK